MVVVLVVGVKFFYCLLYFGEEYSLIELDVRFWRKYLDIWVLGFLNFIIGEVLVYYLCS